MPHTLRQTGSINILLRSYLDYKNNVMHATTYE